MCEEKDVCIFLMCLIKIPMEYFFSQTKTYFASTQHVIVSHLSKERCLSSDLLCRGPDGEGQNNYLNKLFWKRKADINVVILCN